MLSATREVSEGIDPAPRTAGTRPGFQDQHWPVVLPVWERDGEASCRDGADARWQLFGKEPQR